jgi:hypothetical protein
MVNKTKDNVLIIIMSLFSISIEITMIINNIATAKRKILWLKLLLITFLKSKQLAKSKLFSIRTEIKPEMFTPPVSTPNIE